MWLNWQFTGFNYGKKFNFFRKKPVSRAMQHGQCGPGCNHFGQFVSWHDNEQKFIAQHIRPDNAGQKLR
jgi:hypothetical protein